LGEWVEAARVDGVLGVSGRLRGYWGRVKELRGGRLGGTLELGRVVGVHWVGRMSSDVIR